MAATLNPDDVRAWLKGEVFIAPEGTTFPTDVATALAASWKSLGILSQEDGGEWNPSENSTDVFGWGVGKIRKLHNQYAISFKVVALETNPVVEGLLNPLNDASTDGTITTWKHRAPSHVPVAMVIHTEDGTIIERRCANRSDATLSAAFKAAETDVAKREITFDLTADSTAAFFTTISNDPAMVPLGSV